LMSQRNKISMVMNSPLQNAAFNTISSISIIGTALSWFHSYLSDSTQFIQLKSFTSHPVSITTGVPQGSVFDPLLFILYIFQTHYIHCYFLKLNINKTELLLVGTKSTLNKMNPVWVSSSIDITPSPLISTASLALLTFTSTTSTASTLPLLQSPLPFLFRALPPLIWIIATLICLV
uniref:Reverse transcriptase domain-containing protein n=1 Tax=Periophthalmus magnuspinnatus TaxID=409849 RepID=A0A3B4BIH8_9GOBI